MGVEMEVNGIMLIGEMEEQMIVVHKQIILVKYTVKFKNDGKWNDIFPI